MYTYKAKVLRVVDADTMDLLIDIGFSIHIKERVRLIGIDTPEVRTRDLEEKARGLKASKYVKDMVESVKGCIEIETHKQKKGKFGRYLVTVWVDVSGEGQLENLNEKLIELGHAKAYWGKSKKGLHDA